MNLPNIQPSSYSGKVLVALASGDGAGMSTRRLAELARLSTDKVAPTLHGLAHRPAGALVSGRGNTRARIWYPTIPGLELGRRLAESTPLPAPVTEDTTDASESIRPVFTPPPPPPPPADTPPVAPAPFTQPTAPVFSFDTLVDSLARSIASQVLLRVHDYVRDGLADLMPPLVEAPVALTKSPDADNGVTKWVADITGTAKKPRVLIAGLLPDQAQMITKEFSDVFDLRYFQANDNLQKWKTMVPFGDYVITFTSKISHAVEEIVTRAGKKTIRCSGGMSMLRDRLTELYVQTQEETQ